MASADFARLMTAFLTEYLPLQRNLSGNTIRAYCGTFRLFLIYVRDQRKTTPERLSFETVSYECVGDFLQWLEKERLCSAATRNQRLAAIHSFARYVQIESPVYMLQCQAILSIPFKKTEVRTITYLTVDDMRLLLEQPDYATKQGRRDLTMLSLLYDSGARVQEIADLCVRDLRLDHPAAVHLTGKGRKSRLVPLLDRTVSLLRTYLDENHLYKPDKLNTPLFVNRQGNRLTRAGIAYVLKKYAVEAAVQSPLLPQKISPHVLRHTKAMHLLESDVNLAYIRDILGHVDIGTTEIYAKADLSMKRRALEKSADVAPSTVPWVQNTDLLEWLKQYGKR